MQNGSGMGALALGSGSPLCSASLRMRALTRPAQNAIMGQEGNIDCILGVLGIIKVPAALSYPPMQSSLDSEGCRGGRGAIRSADSAVPRPPRLQCGGV